MMGKWITLVLLIASAAPKNGQLEVIRTIPHSGYSEGLDYKDGYLWNALPTEIVKIDPQDGAVLLRAKPATTYSESVVWVGANLWNVSFETNGIYEGIFKNGAFTFTRRGTTPEEHAWGMEKVGKELVLTGNYSKRLYFLNQKTLQLVRSIETPVRDVEDLAWDGEGLWASSYTEQPGHIFRINPKNGTISQFFSLPNPQTCPVIDGLAYDGKNLWLTGKHCPSIFNVKMPSVRILSSN